MLPHFLITILLLAPAPRLLLPAPAGSTLQARILASAVETLAERYPADVHHLEVQVMRTGGRLEEALPLRVNMPRAAALPRAHLQVKVHQEEDGLWQEKGWVMLYIAHYDSVGVTTRQIKKGQQISKGDLKFMWVETTRFRGQPLNPNSLDLLGKKGEIYAHRHLNEAHVLREGDVQHAFDVETGQSVNMTYRRDQFTLELTCKARMQGMTGDEIKLFAPATNKTYRARITGPGKAEWLETLE